MKPLSFSPTLKFLGTQGNTFTDVPEFDIVLNHKTYLYFSCLISPLCFEPTKSSLRKVWNLEFYFYKVLGPYINLRTNLYYPSNTIYT